MEYSIFMGIMTTFCIVYMGTLYVSTNTLLKAQPSSNDLLNFKVLMMINSSQSKFMGMIFVCLALILCVFIVLGDIKNSPWQPIGFHGFGVRDLLMIFMVAVSALYLYTQMKLNRLFNSLDLLGHTVPTAIKVQINQLNKTNNLMFVLFCVILSFQIILQVLRIG